MTLNELKRLDEALNHVRLAEALLDELEPKPTVLAEFILEVKTAILASIKLPKHP